MLLDEVHKLQAEFPDAVYEPAKPDSSYFVYGYTVGSAGDGVGCIVGQAWQRLGVSTEEIESVENDARKMDEGSDVSVMLSRVGFHTGPDISQLMKIQRDQDCGCCWEECG